MIRTNTLALAAALAIGSTGALHAQSEENGMGMMSMAQHCPMMMGTAQGPEAALRHAEVLDLTADQVELLESLRAENAEAHRAAMERMRPIHEQIAAVAREPFDEAAVGEAFARMGDLHEELGVTMLRARHQTSQVLNADQREAFAALHSDPMDGMGSMEGMAAGKGMGMLGMMGMMKHCPMMHGDVGKGSSEEQENPGHHDGGTR